MILTSITTHSDYLELLNLTFLKKWDLHRKRVEFGRQELKLDMFVPCDPDGNILEEPEFYNEWICELNKGIEHEYDSYFMKRYQEAQEKVLFEGFEVDYEEGCVFPFLGSYPIAFFDHNNKWVISSEFRDVESLADYDRPLTKTAIKQLRL